MRSVLIPSLVVCLLCLTAQARAQDLGTAAPSQKRLLADCMLKRMSAERALSYHDAIKLCREQVKIVKPATAANAVAKPLS